MADFWTSLSSKMSSRRHSHAQLLLRNGAVLITGGARDEQHTNPVAGSDFYIYTSKSFQAGPALGNARFHHEMALLPNDEVLVAGGFEVFDPFFMPALSTELYRGGSSFSSSHATNREGRNIPPNPGPYTVALAPPGAGALFGASPKVLCTVLSTGTPVQPTWPPTQAQLASLVLFEQVANLGAVAPGKFFINQATGVMTFDAADAGKGILVTYVYQTGTVTNQRPGPMVTPRGLHALITLPSGKVLAVGGISSLEPGNPVLAPEIYDPSSGAWAELVPLHYPRFIGRSAAILLKKLGRVLCTGGWNLYPNDPSFNYSNIKDEVESFDPLSETFSNETQMLVRRSDHFLVELDCGRVLIGGGAASLGGISALELYDPVSGTSQIQSQLRAQRGGCDPQKLADGRVLIAGGTDENIFTNLSEGLSDPRTSELYDPATGFTLQGPSLPADMASSWQRSTLLPDRTVLFTGGMTADRGTDNAQIYNPEL